MKIKKMSVVLACMLVLTLCLTACGSSKYAGTWEATKAEGNGVTMDASEIYQNFTLTLKSGGKATVNLNGTEGEGSWKETDNGIQLIDSEETMDFTDENGALVVESDGVRVIFEKQ